MSKKTKLTVMIGTALIGSVAIFYFVSNDKSQDLIMPFAQSTQTSERDNEQNTSIDHVGAASNSATMAIKGSAASAPQRAAIIAELQRLKHCEENNSCPIDNSDPRAAYFALGSAVAKQLKDYREQLFTGVDGVKQASDVVREFIDFPEGHVQEEALNLMAELPSDEDNARALISTLRSSYDALIVRQGINELQRYPQLSADIDQLMIDTLTTGSPNVARDVALHIAPLINDNNIATFQALAQSLPQHAAKTKTLQATLHEYELRRSGG